MMTVFDQSKVERFEELTNRQREVAALLVIGKTNQEIATELACSSKTVDTHRGAILFRLGLRNNVELARKAIKDGFVGL